MGRLEPPSQATQASYRADSTQDELEGEPELGLPSYEQAADDGVKESGGVEANGGEDEQKQVAGGRFGRWGGWIEKRALERHIDDTERPERREARRHIDSTTRPPSYDASVASVINMPMRDSVNPRASIQSLASESSFGFDPDSQTALPMTPQPRPQPPGVPLPPTDLTRIDYGSRFLAYSTATITSTLSLPGGMMLVGTAEGLRLVLPDIDDPPKTIWTGLPVWDMTLLKQDVGNGGTPRGSVLVLCGGSEDGQSGRPRKDAEARVWKLESLASLARWTALQDVDYDGMELTPPKGKGKGVAPGFRAFSRGGSGSGSASSSMVVNARQPNGYDLALRWTRDYTVLPSGNRPVLAMTTHTTATEMSIALATPESIVLHSGRVTETGSYSFSPAKTFYIPFPPTTVSIVELEIPGSLAESIDDCSSSLFEWDGDRSEYSLGEGVLGGVLGLFITFSGGRGCIIRTDDLKIVELKKGGRGDWLPVQKVRLPDSEAYTFTRGSSTFILGAPLTIPLAMQVPVTEITWPELPTSIHATTSPGAGIRLIGLTVSGTIHIIDVNPGERGLEKDWACAKGALGDKARFVPDARLGGNRAGLEDGHGSASGVVVGFRKRERDWRIVRLGQRVA